MRKAFSIFSLGIIFLNVAGFYIFFFLQIWSNRATMHEQLRSLPAEQLEKIYLSPEEFVRVRVDEHEIKIGGRMYDIARVHTEGDSIIVYALHDAREDNLLNFVSFIINEPISKKEMKQFAQFLLLLYLHATVLQYVIPELEYRPNTRYINHFQDLVTQKFFIPPRR